MVHNFNLFKVEKDKLALYYGIGGRIKIIEDESRIGIRVPGNDAQAHLPAWLDKSTLSAEKHTTILIPF